MLASCRKSLAAALLAVFYLALGLSVYAQSGNSTSITGVVVDPTGAVVPHATVEIQNPVSGYIRSVTTDNAGKFTFPNVPFNPYHLTVTGEGFANQVQDIEVRSSVPLNLTIKMQVPIANTSVTVQAGAEDLLENTPTFHTDVDRSLIEKMPLESASSSVSSLVTLATPGVAADSNGLFHGLGDHAENSFSVDGQPITDQQSKVFSNQIPLDSIQSIEVISGAPPAEYGDKTSLVIDVTTRSGQGVTTPHGGVTAQYGSFGSSNLDTNLSYGGKNWGNFIAANGLNTGRFLDPPEFTVLHDKGNEENVFDRVDYQFSNKDSMHLDAGYSRSWFQTPNTFDGQNATPWSGLDKVLPAPWENYGGIGPNGLRVGPTDQRSKIQTFNIAPTWTHLLSDTTLFTLGPWVRRDGYNYYPSDNPFADLGPPSLQRESVGQDRSLTNAGARTTLSYVKGIHNVKAGVSYEQTFLNENDTLGIVDPAYNAPCVTPYSGASAVVTGAYVAVPGFASPSQCAGAGYLPNNGSYPGQNLTLYPAYNPTLAPYDLTRGGSSYVFNGHTDVKELAMYVQDSITTGPWNFNLGIRGDLYNGLTTAQQAEPRLGAAYNIKRTKTVLRLSYARTLETPFNENLVLSSRGCENPVLSPLLLCSSSSLTPLSPGRRNEYHAGLQQAFGRYIVFSGEYIWKYTHNAYDFSVLGDTPITFPIEWTKSKIPGVAGRVDLTNYHGLTAFTVFSSVAARFFLPQVGGAGATPAAPSGVFRIDHDEKFNQTTHFQYQPWKRGPWMGFNWRFDSGLVAGNTPCYGVGAGNDCPQSITLNGQSAIRMTDYAGNPLSADLEFEGGFMCNGVRATPTTPLPFVCPASEFSSSLIKVPAPGTENDDHNPPRTQPRSLFDVSLGHDNLFHGDKYKWSAQFTVINLTNKYALYNFLSTFSGTHYVSPRSYTGEVGFHF
ncbi:MAG: TonB-dependent receptor [Candidatus Korobacteraceae bacterium]